MTIITDGNDSLRVTHHLSPEEVILTVHGTQNTDLGRVPSMLIVHLTFQEARVLAGMLGTATNE